jgi:predicted outer membrane protein
MRQGWRAAATVAALAALFGACRAEEHSDQALGTTSGYKGKSAPVPAEQPKKEAPRPITAEPRIVRLLGFVQIQNEAEIETARLANERATTPAVKAFAAMALRDHQELADALADIVRSKNLDLLSAVGEEPLLGGERAAQLELGQRLRTLTGPQFEGAYLAGQPAMHLALANAAEQGRQASDDRDIAGFFQRVAAIARAHRDMALSAMPTTCGGTGEAAPAPGTPAPEGGSTP